jgi:hypothetical protein
VSAVTRRGRSVSTGLSAAVLLVCARAGAEPPVCLASAVLEPPVAFVGEQVVWRAQILRRDDVRHVDWGRAPAFPGLRVEALPSLASDTAVWREDRRYEGFEERRALFALRPGEIVLPDASLRCRPGPGSATGDVEAVIPGARLRVRELPERDPAIPFDGAVGSVSVQASLEPASLALGRAARLSIFVEGEADLFDLSSPFDAEASASADLEILARPAELARDTGRRLRLRRWFRYDLIPHRAGSFELPALRVGWLDPASGRYEVASAPAQRLVVREAASADPERRPRARAGVEGAAAAEPPRSRVVILAVLFAGAALLAGGAVLARRRRERDGAAEERVRAELELAGAARAAGERERENAALARALRLAFEAAGLPGARTRSTEELLASALDDAELRAAADLLARLDNARFGAQPDAAPGAEVVAGAARRLLARGRGRPPAARQQSR